MHAEEAVTVTPEPLVTAGAIRVYERLLRPLKGYHRHRSVGVEHVPATGGAMLVMHHTLATYDAFLLGLDIYDATGRLPAAMGDDLIFKTPWLKDWAMDGGVRPANAGAGLRLLQEGHMLAVAPGGMWECLRPSSQARQHRWHERRGFVKLALRAQVPLVLAACPAGDDIYRIRESRITNGVYRRLRAPLPVARGVGLSLIPRPVQLTHFVAEPLVPPPLDPDREDEQVADLHARAMAVMEGLLARR